MGSLALGKHPSAGRDKRPVVLVFAALAAILLCSEPLVAQTSGAVEIVVYRPGLAFGSLLRSRVNIGDSVCLKVMNNSTFSFRTNSPVVVRTKDAELYTPLGQEKVFLRLTLLPGFWRIRHILIPVERAFGEEEVQQMGSKARTAIRARTCR